MLELFKAGGLLMWPLLLCSILSIGITIERLWSLRRQRIAPYNLIGRVWRWQRSQQLDMQQLQELQRSSQLGRILAAGLRNRHQSREVMRDSIQEVGRHVAHQLNRFLTTLGTIASITPLLGLLGTVIGMIKVFGLITAQGVGNPGVLAAGINEALITTAFGLAIAIPTLMFYRYLRGKVDELVIDMEQEAMKLVEAMHGRRQVAEGQEQG